MTTNSPIPARGAEPGEGAPCVRCGYMDHHNVGDWCVSCGFYRRGADVGRPSPDALQLFVAFVGQGHVDFPRTLSELSEAVDLFRSAEEDLGPDVEERPT